MAELNVEIDDTGISETQISLEAFEGAKQGESFLFFQMIQNHQQAAEKRQQAAAEKRLLLQMEEKGIRAKEKRLQLAQFLVDAQHYAGRFGESSTKITPEKI